MLVADIDLYGTPQPAFNCSKLTMETAEQYVKSVLSQQ